MNDTNYKSIDFGALTRAGEGLTQWRALAMGFLTARQRPSCSNCASGWLFSRA